MFMGLERISERRYYVQNYNGTFANAYCVYDGHGSVRALTDATGGVTDTYDYDAYGNLIHSTFTGSAPTPNNYLFAGEQFDPDLNLYYNRARYLNVSTGRFLVCRYLRRRPAVAIVIAQVSLHWR
jgi:YD repeat-containing protein